MRCLINCTILHIETHSTHRFAIQEMPLEQHDTHRRRCRAVQKNVDISLYKLYCLSNSSRVHKEKWSCEKLKHNAVTESRWALANSSVRAHDRNHAYVSYLEPGVQACSMRLKYILYRTIRLPRDVQGLLKMEPMIPYSVLEKLVYIDSQYNECGWSSMTLMVCNVALWLW